MSRSAAVAVAVPLAVCVVGTAGCVAEGPPTGDLHLSTSSSAGAPALSAGTDDPPLGATFEDRFDRSELGPDWRALSPVWRIEDGKLCGRGARNRGVWLRRVLPTDARIEVTAVARSAEGDVKMELWGDGRTGASGATYDDATSYVAILGGWRNARHVLARRDEHGDDRMEIALSPQARVVEGQPMRLRFERRDGRTVRWEVDGDVLFELEDDAPLRGPGHDHVGFNGWEAPVCFDDLRIEPLGSSSAADRPPGPAD